MARVQEIPVLGGAAHLVLRREPWVLSDALTATLWTLLHGDWKMGNLATTPTGA